MYCLLSALGPSWLFLGAANILPPEFLNTRCLCTYGSFHVSSIAGSLFLGTEKSHKLFHSINFLAPNLGPQKKFMCLISWERAQKGDPHKLFRGDFWGQQRGPKRGIFGHKKFSLLFFSCPYVLGNGPNTVSGSTVSNTELSEIQKGSQSSEERAQ